MENQSRTRRIILIIIAIGAVCALLCLVAFFLLGGVSLLSGPRIVMGTAVRNQQPAPPVEIIAPQPVENLPTEISTPETPFSEPSTITPTPTQPTSTPPLPVAASCVPANERDRAIVVQVLDGESLRVVMHEQTYTVRYLGILAPKFGLESEPFGPEAASLNKMLVQDQIVTLVKDTTNENEAGDLLRYVFAGDHFVNQEMVRQGLAQAVSTPPDTSCDDELLQAQQSAQQEHLGQWKDFVATGIPTLTPTLDLTASATPQAAAGPCDCKGPDLDCTDFATRADAQACYD
jgi:micrococcal nuclease